MGFLNLLKKFLGFFWPTCSPGKLKSFGREQAKIFHLVGDQEDYRKSISLPQLRRLLIMAVDCLNESLEASEVDGSFPMPPTFF